MHRKNRIRSPQYRWILEAQLLSGERFQMMLKLAAVFAMAIAGTWSLPLVAAADAELMDCREVDCFQRAECNRRVLAALHSLKTTVSEHRAYQSPATTTKQIMIQRERQERLQSFWAPECKPTASPAERHRLSLATAWEGFSRLFTGPSKGSAQATNHTWSPPALARPILLDEEGRTRLLARWDGWLSFHDDRSVRLWFQIIEARFGGYVKACSDQGMVMGRVTDEGVLDLPRREAFGSESRILLWRSPPYADDLEGVLIIETEPGRAFDSGLVWLSRALTRANPVLPTDYPCQDKEILDRRKGIWNPSSP